MNTDTLYLHRAEFKECDGKIILERVPEKPHDYNCGVEYRIGIQKIDDKRARVLGWATGYPTLECDRGSEGTVYAPEGFQKGKLAYVDINDKLLTESKMGGSSIKDFIANLKIIDSVHKIDMLKDYSFVGFILISID